MIRIISNEDQSREVYIKYSGKSYFVPYGARLYIRNNALEDIDLRFFTSGYKLDILCDTPEVPSVIKQQYPEFLTKYVDPTVNFSTELKKDFGNTDIRFGIIDRRGNVLYPTIEPSGGNYNELNNKPQINGISLFGNKSPENLGLASIESSKRLSNRLDSVETMTQSNNASINDLYGRKVDVQAGHRLITPLEESKLNNLPNEPVASRDYVDNRIQDLSSDVVHKDYYEIPGDTPDAEPVKINKVLSEKDFTTDLRNKLDNLPDNSALLALLDTKVDKETDKGLSTNNFSNEYKERVDNLAQDYERHTGYLDKLHDALGDDSDLKYTVDGVSYFKCLSEVNFTRDASKTLSTLKNAFINDSGTAVDLADISETVKVIDKWYEDSSNAVNRIIARESDIMTAANNINAKANTAYVDEKLSEKLSLTNILSNKSSNDIYDTYDVFNASYITSLINTERTNTKTEYTKLVSDTKDELNKLINTNKTNIDSLDSRMDDAEISISDMKDLNSKQNERLDNCLTKDMVDGVVNENYRIYSTDEIDQVKEILTGDIELLNSSLNNLDTIVKESTLKVDNIFTGDVLPENADEHLLISAERYFRDKGKIENTINENFEELSNRIDTKFDKDKVASVISDSVIKDDTYVLSAKLAKEYIDAGDSELDSKITEVNDTLSETISTVDADLRILISTKEQESLARYTELNTTIGIKEQESLTRDTDLAKLIEKNIENINILNETKLKEEDFNKLSTIITNINGYVCEDNQEIGDHYILDILYKNADDISSGISETKNQQILIPNVDAAHPGLMVASDKRDLDIINTLLGANVNKSSALFGGGDGSPRPVFREIQIADVVSLPEELSGLHVEDLRLDTVIEENKIALNDRVSKIIETIDYSEDTSDARNLNRLMTPDERIHLSTLPRINENDVNPYGTHTFVEILNGIGTLELMGKVDKEFVSGSSDYKVLSDRNFSITHFDKLNALPSAGYSWDVENVTLKLLLDGYAEENTNTFGKVDRQLRSTFGVNPDLGKWQVLSDNNYTDHDFIKLYGLPTGVKSGSKTTLTLWESKAKDSSLEEVLEGDGVLWTGKVDKRDGYSLIADKLVEDLDGTRSLNELFQWKLLTDATSAIEIVNDPEHVHANIIRVLPEGLHLPSTQIFDTNKRTGYEVPISSDIEKPELYQHLNGISNTFNLLRGQSVTSAITTGDCVLDNGLWVHNVTGNHIGGHDGTMWMAHFDVDSSLSLKQIDETDNKQYFNIGLKELPVDAKANTNYNLVAKVGSYVDPSHIEYAWDEGTTLKESNIPEEVDGDNKGKRLLMKSFHVGEQSGDNLNIDMELVDVTSGELVTVTDTWGATEKSKLQNWVNNGVVLPTPPTTDGDYALKLSIKDGIPTYTWEEVI